MSSKRLTVRVSDAEHQFLLEESRKKGLDLSATMRHFFMQNIALESIKNEVRGVLETELIDVIARLEVLEQTVADSVSRDDLKKAVNFLSERIKK
jgi:hypothetical protein